jgi:hypothetical protein
MILMQMWSNKFTVGILALVHIASICVLIPEFIAAFNAGVIFRYVPLVREANSITVRVS